MPFFVLWETESRPEQRVKTSGVLAARQVFATREEAEDGIRQMIELGAGMGAPVPDFQIIEAPTIREAMSQVTGFPFPGP